MRLGVQISNAARGSNLGCRFQSPFGATPELLHDAVLPKLCHGERE